MLLSVRDLTKTYKRDGRPITAVDHLTLSVAEGQLHALIGESGSGKSTLVRLIAQLITPDSGQILFDGQDLSQLKTSQKKGLYRHMQLVFQNPAGSFHPRHTLAYSIREGLRNFHLTLTEEEKEQLLQEVHLTRDQLDRYPHQVSGGECQRAAILRALCVKPGLLLCDEATSALDVSIRSEIAGLIRTSCNRHGITCLFVTHDLYLAGQISDTTSVLHQGRLIETGPTKDVFRNPTEPYTRQLMESLM